MRFARSGPGADPFPPPEHGRTSVCWGGADRTDELEEKVTAATADIKDTHARLRHKRLEHGQAPEEPLLVGREQIVTPADGVPERALPGRQIPPESFAIAVWLLSAPLMGLVMATYTVPSPVTMPVPLTVASAPMSNTISSSR